MFSLYRIILINTFINVQTVTSSLISWDAACGSKKGCFPDCRDGCEYLVTWSTSSSSIQFTLQAEETGTNVYLAVGFSNDYRMGDDSVVGCILPSSKVYSYYNEGDNTKMLSPATLGLGARSINQSNGVITCSFTRNLSEADDRFFNLNNDFILMLVVGKVEQKRGKTEMKEHERIPWSSESKVDFNRHYVVGLHKLNTPVVKLHGVMMVLAWLLFVTIGIVTARYNKNMLREKELFGTKIWFQVHRGAMVVALIFVIIGFISIFVEIGGYSQVVSTDSAAAVQAHPVIGIIVTVLGFVNPIMAIFRPGGDHKLRWIFNWAHLGVGALSLLLAVVNIFLGYFLERSMVSKSAIYITIVHVVIVVVVCCSLEVHKRTNVKQTKDAAEVDSNRNRRDLKEKFNINKNLPFVLLVTLGGVLIVLSIAVIAVIATS
ncbi:putative ferric-chelate reductase 1 homolog [Mercenaria mercenaria]|uniref:putative ferric-chelate reductase 1 homolog n=1 Tax=Mercenaria mercenaria TaxID=6596 RepID=UPI00234FA851|nr:putative ferric-chelate reductase 1 homolog [Mercenaria mercenaria]